jgi:hypothetical protein
MQISQHKVITAAVIGGVFAIIAAVVGALVTNFAKPEQKQTAILESPRSVAAVPNIYERPSGADITSARKEPGSVVQADEEDQLRRRLREEHGVRLIEIAENQLKFSAAPRKVYGFDQPMEIHDSNFLQLNREFSRSIQFEFHKMSDGKGEIIVFVSPDVATMLNRTDRPPGFRATLYNRMWVSAPVIDSIPLNALSKEYEERTIKFDNNNEVLALDVIIK